MEAITDNKLFDAVKKHGKKNYTFDRAKSNRREILMNCKYCRFT